MGPTERGTAQSKSLGAARVNAGAMTSAAMANLKRYLTREPVMLALLTVLAIVCFAGVSGLSRLFHAQQEALGNRWFTRGVSDLKAQRFDRAVVEFRAALEYSRDDYSYQLNLAEALIGQKRTSQAYAYLINLWDRQPEDGVVNLELARIAAERNETEQAQRYYHNAIYATWPEGEETERHAARLELIEYLLKIDANTQAQAELIALEANLGDDPAEQARLGDLFVRAQDYEHALGAYRVALKSERHNAEALAGAGLAAFELQHYDTAQRYLQAAVMANPEDEKSAGLLQTTELVLQMDPFQRQITAEERARVVQEAFATAGDRLKACGGGNGFAMGAGSTPSLAQSWTEMKPRITTLRLRRDPDLVESAMDLVFNIERQTSAKCGTPAGKDEALLLIAKLHEGS
jgi:tetratricopeptide (TPR) repeat protein